MVVGKQGHAPYKDMWLWVSKGMLLIKTVVVGKQGHAPYKDMWLFVSKGMLLIKTCSCGLARACSL